MSSLRIRLSTGVYCGIRFSHTSSARTMPAQHLWWKTGKKSSIRHTVGLDMPSRTAILADKTTAQKKDGDRKRPERPTRKRVARESTPVVARRHAKEVHVVVLTLLADRIHHMNTSVRTAGRT